MDFSDRHGKPGLGLLLMSHKGITAFDNGHSQLLQSRLSLSDPTMEGTLYEIPPHAPVRTPATERTDTRDTTIMNFRNLLEKNQLQLFSLFGWPI